MEKEPSWALQVDIHEPSLLTLVKGAFNWVWGPGPSREEGHYWS